MVNYACGFNQSETGKYFEWMINSFIVTITFISFEVWLTGLNFQGPIKTLKNVATKAVQKTTDSGVDCPLMFDDTR